MALLSRIVACLFAALCSTQVVAQPQLPAIACVRTDTGVVLSWVCQYEGVASVVVRRSADSMRDYVDIGTVYSAARGVQGFTDDAAPEGKCYYKVTVVFNSGLRWTSNHCGTAEATDSLDRPSRYVRTNSFTGHVEVMLPPDATKHAYALRFYNSKGQMVLDAPVVRETNVIIDRRNFPRRGSYRFELQKDGVLFEKGTVLIGK